MAEAPTTDVPATTGTPTPTPPADTNAPAATADDTLAEGGKKALEAERRARRDAEDRLKELEPLAEEARKRADADKTEAQKLTESLDTERKARTVAETALLRYQVAADKGVPANLVRFLTGDDKAAVEEAAALLLKEIGAGGEDRPSVPGRPTERMSSGRPSTALDDEDPMALVAKARGQSPPK